MTATFTTDRLARVALTLMGSAPAAVTEDLIEAVAASTPTTTGIAPRDTAARPGWLATLTSPHLRKVTGGTDTTRTSLWLATVSDGNADTDKPLSREATAAAFDEHDLIEDRLSDRAQIATVWAADRAVLVRTWTPGANTALYTLHTATTAA